MTDGIEIRLESHIPEVTAAITEEARKRMLLAVQEVRNETMETLSGQRTGRIYKVPGTNRTYTASSPGEPPAVATGRLRQSIKGVTENNGLTGLVGTEIDYGPMLEFGTSKMASRPWLRKSFEKAEKAVLAIFGREWLK